MNEHSTPNRLIHQKSPYLLQHAYNPVDWYPWGEEAFEKSRREEKPIFLSIGYSSCYWCHVMEREVFEDKDIARLMNEKLVCIKVDREEQPDIDRIYMTAVQALTGSGGWPMSVFLTPQLKPFYGATYIPPQASPGRPGFPDIVFKISEIWQTEREKILQRSEQITEFLRQEASAGDARAADPGVLTSGFQRFRNLYDKSAAGFGGAPKFPRPVVFSFLLRYYWRTGEQDALQMSLDTLRAMARGGMYDQLGGGFHRYSVDPEWRVPHFEKMLYDQAQLVRSFLEAYQITRDGFYADVARDVLAYVFRVLKSPEGAFYSAEDAESALDPSTPDGKHEGACYLWTAAEIRRILDGDGDDAGIVMDHYGVEEKGNVAHDPMHVFAGKNILYQARSVEETARRSGKGLQEVRLMLTSGKEKLFRRREERPRPHRDDKVIACWNGMMISACARAAGALREPAYLSAAEEAAHSVLSTLYKPETGILFRRYRDGETRFPGTLADYSSMALGLLDLYEISGEIRWLNDSITLTKTQNELFSDRSKGGFFDNPGDDTSQIVRTKEFYDGAEPSGNALAALSLLRLARVSDNPSWRAMAEETIRSFGGKLHDMPEAAPQMLVALDLTLAPRREIVIAGPSDAEGRTSILQEVFSRFLPYTTLLHADGGSGQETLSGFLPFINQMTSIGKRAAAYICENYSCQLPTSDPSRIAEILEREAPGHPSPS